MIILVYGGSASGKSSFAEQTVMELLPEGPKYYIATMQAYGEEGKLRVARHVKLREGKGFHTIECPVDIEASLNQIPEPSEAVILIECVSNLAANEMFDRGQSREAVTQKVVTEIREVCRRVKHAVIVTNNIFEDGAKYAKETKEYIQCLGDIDRQLARLADEVIEVTAARTTAIMDRLKRPPEKGAGYSMQLVIGGTAQGKKDYVIRQLQSRGLNYYVIDEKGIEPDDIPPDTQALVLDHLHLLIRRFGAEGPARAYLRQVMDLCKASGIELIIICDEVGNGVVPLEKEERDYRENVGRIVCSLAQEAASVRRIVCGFSQVLF